MPSPRTLELLADVPDPFQDTPEDIAEAVRAIDEVGLSVLGMGPLYFDREGEPITLGQWVRLREFVPDYFRVAFDDLGLYHVSTVWLGLDHGFGFGRPVIFESMVFASELSWSKPNEWFPETYPYHQDFEQRRYCTEEEALAGHQELVNEVRLVADAMKGIDPRAGS